MVEEKYNNIFETLVLSQGEDDSLDSLAGMLAYAEYKRHKMEFFRGIQKDHERQPTKEEIDGFVRTYQNKGLLDTLKEKYGNTLINFALDFTEERVKEQISEAKQNALMDEIKRNGSSWRAIGYSVCGSFLYTILAALILIAFALVSPDSGLGNWVKHAFLERTVPVGSAQPSPK